MFADVLIKYHKICSLNVVSCSGLEAWNRAFNPELSTRT